MIHLGLDGICHSIPSLLHVTKARYLGLIPRRIALHIAHTLSLHSHSFLNLSENSERKCSQVGKQKVT